MIIFDLTQNFMCDENDHSLEVKQHIQTLI